MDILDLVKEVGYDPKWKSSTHGGEYCSPCPFCQGGDDRLLIWPKRHDEKTGEYAGGQFSCFRHCRTSGSAINFLYLLYGIKYREARDRLHLPSVLTESISIPRPEKKPHKAEDPPILWMEKAGAFVNWSHEQLMKSPEALAKFHERGFTSESIKRFKLGYNPENYNRNRPDWGLLEVLDENGKPKNIWLSQGLTIPTFSPGGQVIKVNVRRTAYEKEKHLYEAMIASGKDPQKKPRKYVFVTGTKKAPSIFGDVSLPCALILESELDALLIQQEAEDLVYCVALGGASKPIDADTDAILRDTPIILFLSDIDEAGATASLVLEEKFPNIEIIVPPKEKSAGDYFKNGGNLRGWLEGEIREIQNKSIK